MGIRGRINWGDSQAPKVRARNAGRSEGGRDVKGIQGDAKRLEVAIAGEAKLIGKLQWRSRRQNKTNMVAKVVGVGSDDDNVIRTHTTARVCSCAAELHRSVAAMG